MIKSLITPHKIEEEIDFKKRQLLLNKNKQRVVLSDGKCSLKTFSGTTVFDAENEKLVGEYGERDMADYTIFNGTLKIQNENKNS